MKKLIFLILILTIFGSVYPTFSQNVSQWRGPDRDGKYNETQLLKEWPENWPQLLWSTETLGHGYAAPVVTSDKLFVNGVVNGESHLFAFDLKGKLLWKSPNGIEFIGEGYSANFPGARPTPTVVNNLVYTSSGLGRIACFEAATGKEKWAEDELAADGNSVKEIWCNPQVRNSMGGLIVIDGKLFVTTELNYHVPHGHPVRANHFPGSHQTLDILRSKTDIMVIFSI